MGEFELDWNWTIEEKKKVKLKRLYDKHLKLDKEWDRRANKRDPWRFTIVQKEDLLEINREQRQISDEIDELEKFIPKR